jgi:hypothetical protein
MSVLAEKVIGKVYCKKAWTSSLICANCQDQAMQFFAKFHILVILKKFRTSVTYYIFDNILHMQTKNRIQLWNVPLNTKFVPF